MNRGRIQVVWACIVVFLLISISLSALIAFYGPSDDSSLPVGEYDSGIRRFSSSQELKDYMEDSIERYLEAGSTAPSGLWLLSGTEQTTDVAMAASDYSETNIQVEGVDEPDIVKTDGTYLYVASNREVALLRIHPGSRAGVLSRIELAREAYGLFVTDSRLVVLTSMYYYDRDILHWHYFYGTCVLVYDTTSKSKPRLIQNVSIEGYYVDARMIGDYVYFVVSTYGRYSEDEIELPFVIENGSPERVQASEVYYWEGQAPSYRFAIVASINVQDRTFERRVYLTDSGHEMYVSTENIYLVRHHYSAFRPRSMWSGFPNTIIQKISIDEGEIRYVNSGVVPGWVLNQFSMDEHRSYFRIATTTGSWSERSLNNVYVLNRNMETVGKLEGLAPGETIYSARFVGDRCYLVTFKKIDPFFVIDMGDPKSPKMLGKLKIPGFSSYLHPYDENHVIGVGKEGEDMGNFAWFQGLKLSLFDVTDVTRPKEVAKYEIGDRGTDSEVLHEHKAFMFSKSKDLLIIPVTLYEVDEDDYPDGVPPNAYGEFVAQGAFVFKLTLRDGFKFKGIISHTDEDDALNRSWYSQVRRSLYIEDEIITVSNTMVKINEMDSLEEIVSIELR